MDINKIKLSPNASIKQALNTIGKERVRLGIIVDKDDKFLGVISDSNIRKALIDGKSVNDSIKNIYTKNALTIRANLSEDELFALSSKTDIYDFPVVDEKGVVIGVRSVASALQRQRLTNAVVLMAGGLGTRLAPLTNTTPKPMLKVGKKPILETIIQRFHAQGFENFTLCVNYKKQIIEDYFENGAKFGVKISYTKERSKLGTAGALSLLKGVSESFIVMNADILTELDFKELLKVHKKSKAALSVCVREFSYQVPYGVIEKKGNFIGKITEKPTQKFLVSAGIYVCEPQILAHIPKNKYLDMPNLTQMLLEKGFKVYSYLINDYWIDIGRMDEFEKANKDFIL